MKTSESLQYTARTIKTTFLFVILSLANLLNGYCILYFFHIFFPLSHLLRTYCGAPSQGGDVGRCGLPL